MKVWIFANVNFLEFDEKRFLSIEGFEYRDNDTIESLNTFLNNTEIWKVLGSAAINKYIDTPYFIKTVALDKNESVKQALDKSHHYLEQFIRALWFSKDNCADISFTEAFSEATNKSFSIYPTLGYSKADCTGQTTVFDVNDFDFANRMLWKILEIRQGSVRLPERFPPGKSTGINIAVHSISYNAFNRIQRALAFKELARTMKMLPPKIAFYVLTLECLFAANDSIEIMHKLGERIAIYLGRNYEERIKIYEEFKVAYNIRSKYIHGQAIEGYIKEKDEIKLVAISVSLDDMVRAILIKIILVDSDKFLLPSDKQKEWFNSMLFGKDENANK